MYLNVCNLFECIIIGKSGTTNFNWRHFLKRNTPRDRHTFKFPFSCYRLNCIWEWVKLCLKWLYFFSESGCTAKNESSRGLQLQYPELNTMHALQLLFIRKATCTNLLYNSPCNLIHNVFRCIVYIKKCSDQTAKTKHIYQDRLK